MQAQRRNSLFVHIKLSLLPDDAAFTATIANIMCCLLQPLQVEEQPCTAACREQEYFPVPGSLVQCQDNFFPNFACQKADRRITLMYKGAKSPHIVYMQGRNRDENKTSSERSQCYLFLYLLLSPDSNLSSMMFKEKSKSQPGIYPLLDSHGSSSKPQ